jgi:hypothetical protein
VVHKKDTFEQVIDGLASSLLRFACLCSDVPSKARRGSAPRERELQALDELGDDGAAGAVELQRKQPFGGARSVTIVFGWPLSCVPGSCSWTFGQQRLQRGCHGARCQIA